MADRDIPEVMVEKAAPPPIKRGTARRLTLAPPPTYWLDRMLSAANLPPLTPWQRVIYGRLPDTFRKERGNA